MPIASLSTPRICGVHKQITNTALLNTIYVMWWPVSILKINLTRIRCPELVVSSLTSCHREPHITKALRIFPTHLCAHKSLHLQPTYEHYHWVYSNMQHEIHLHKERTLFSLPCAASCLICATWSPTVSNRQLFSYRKKNSKKTFQVHTMSLSDTFIFKLFLPKGPCHSCIGSCWEPRKVLYKRSTWLVRYARTAQLF